MVSSSGASKVFQSTCGTKKRASQWLSTAPAFTQAAQATSCACAYTCRPPMPLAAPTTSPYLCTPCKELLMGSLPGHFKEPSGSPSWTRALRVSITWRQWRLNQIYRPSRSRQFSAIPKDLAMSPSCTCLS